MAIKNFLHDNKYVSLYTEENITIWSKMAIYKSTNNEEYEIITDIVITKDTKENIIYRVNNIQMAYNTKGLVSIADYVEKIVKYINTTTSEPYWIKKFLDNFFINSKTFDIEVYYKRIIKQESEQKEVLQAQETNKQIEDLKHEIQKHYNNDNCIVVYDLFNLIILKNDNKYNFIERQNDKNFKEFIFEGIENNNNTITEYIIKNIKLKWNEEDIKILNELLAS